MTSPLLVFVLFADLALGGPPPAAPGDLPDEVSIVASHGGWTHSQSELTIRRTPAGYRDDQGRVLDDALLRALTAAVAAPVHQLDARRFTVDPMALRKAAEELTQGYPARARARIIARACDPRSLQRLLEALDHSRHTDDYPHVAVELRWQDGRRIALRSDAQYAYMLPWHLAGAGHDERSYDPQLSRALVALLPNGFTERDRLAGVWLPTQLAQMASYQ